MPLQYRFFHIHATDSNKSTEELNRFLASVRIVNIHREFINQGENSFWSVAVEYMTDETGKSGSKGKSKIDYREVLSPEDFNIFAKLREWRKQTSNKEGVPVYTVFKNEHLAKIAETKVISKAELLKIDGIGNARVAKYGDEVISIIKQLLEEQAKNETDRKPVSKNT